MLNVAIISTIIGIGIVGFLMAYITSSKPSSSDVMENGSVKSMSAWIEPNSDEPCYEGKYQERAISNAEKLNATIKEAISFGKFS